MKTENRTYKHLNIDQRCVIRDMVYAGNSAQEIGRELNVSASTIVREIKRNRIIKIPKIRKSNISIYCKNFDTCSHKGDLCDNCLLNILYVKGVNLDNVTIFAMIMRLNYAPKLQNDLIFAKQIAQKETLVGYLNVHTMVLVLINNTEIL